MKNAVIYARYSSGPNQTDYSIEGQLKECREFARRNGYNIVHEYIDRAISGKTDNRPQFQQMMKDCARQKFEIVIVYQLDRFARNRYDSATHKYKLKKYGIRVISARENISDDASGILMESVLEGMAEYYSAELSQKIKRGRDLRIAELKHTGGPVPLGYSLTDDKRYQFDPLTAPIVEKCFQLYAAGNNLKTIAQALADEYPHKISFGNVYNSVGRILENHNYIGYYTRGKEDVKDGMPRVISDELFERVQQMRNKKKKTPTNGRAEEEYFLTSKLFCGHCKERINEDVFMVGVSGTSGTGKVHNYYTCKNVWNKKGCNKKNVRKHEIEAFILNQAREQLTDENISMIAKVVSEISKRENNTPFLAEIKKKLKENAKATNNLLDAIESGEHMELLSERLSLKKQEKVDLENALIREQWDKAELSDSEIKFFLNRLRTGDVDDEKYKRALIAIFINAVYLYDDRAVIVFNTTDRPVTIDSEFVLDKIEKGGYNGESNKLREEGSGSYGNPLSPFR
jgi:DNA invertase Pin-like site-specific DNA recombinase